ncbi:MAG TPA: hypothetical protein VFY23_03530 [Candidatus Limnocylindrales bacterium]|nr:hypothetical protein [Candidatus Limnocylindrales bacterium]
MRAVLVDFASPSEAYAFVSEIRRRADTMLWDVRVRREPDRAVVVVPERTWRADAFVRAVAMTSGGAIREDDRARDRAGQRTAPRT